MPSLPKPARQIAGRGVERDELRSGGEEDARRQIAARPASTPRRARSSASAAAARAPHLLAGVGFEREHLVAARRQIHHAADHDRRRSRDSPGGLPEAVGPHLPRPRRGWRPHRPPYRGRRSSAVRGREDDAAACRNRRRTRRTTPASAARRCRVDLASGEYASRPDRGCTSASRHRESGRHTGRTKQP